MSDALYENEEKQNEPSRETEFVDPNPWVFATSKDYCAYQIVSSIIFIYVFLMFDFFTAFMVFIVYIFISAIYYRTRKKLHSSRSRMEPSPLQ